MQRFLATLAVLLTVLANRAHTEPAPAKPARPARVLPGLDRGGVVHLHNQWSLRPAGRQLVLGDFPVNMALHPTGKWAAVLHAGHGTHEVIVVDLDPAARRILSRVTLKETFVGLCFAPDGRYLYASGGEYDVVHAFRFADGYLSEPRRMRVAAPKEKFIPAGLAMDRAGKRLFVAGTWGFGVCVLTLDDPANRVTVPLGQDSYPYGCLVDDARGRLYVSLWNRAAVAVVDLASLKVVNTFATESHPTEMLLSPDGKALFVACANSTKVSVLSAEDGKGLETIACALYPGAPSGNTPSSLSLTPDGQLLFVANSNANNVAVFNVTAPGKARPLGFIPVGMYPTAVRYNPADKRLYIANGMGTTPRANPHGPNPEVPGRGRTVEEYIADLYRGTLTTLDMPTEEQMVAYTKQAYLCSPLRADQGVTAKRPKDSPIPGKVGDASPIKHCVYIIRENRTYDQVLGDMKEGNGDPHLCLFPEKVTPNAHRLAREYVLLDNFYVEGEVSADGHQWSTGAYCTDFVRKLWPLTYRGSPTKKLAIYPSEGVFPEMERPAGGYIWDRCAAAGVSYRSYGEWTRDGKTPQEPATARVKALEGHIDPWYRGFDLDYSDLKRADRFLAELKRYEREGGLPRFIIMHLPNDHTAGAQVGKRTPAALVAENDLALGRIVEAFSASKFWKETAIFVLEDDAQSGPDHVDAHRSVALVISPYVRRGRVDSTLYSTSSMLRTMELILGLRPMSQFDAAARPMYASFRAEADARPYRHVVPEVDLNAVNKRSTWAARVSERFDLSRPDAVDDLLFSEVIWRAVRGDNARMPPPVRAAFVFPHLEDD
jgi:DNA-binding beta-propeller fold protein YncE